MQYNKLVRDKIPEVLNGKNIPNKFHIADEIEYEEKLFHKLLEEASDLVTERNISELGDVYEVLDAIKTLKGISDEEIATAREIKNRDKGKFEKRIILEES